MRKLSLFLILALLFGLLTGCGEPEIYVPEGPYTRAVEREIKEAFVREHHSGGYTVSDLTMECYGVFGDAYAFFLDSSQWGHFDAITDVTVAGITFTFPSSRTLTVYCDGSFYGLKSAFEEGVLTQSDLETLLKNYKNGAVYTIAEELSAEKIAELEKARFSAEGHPYTFSKESYLGTYSGYVVFFDSGQLAVVTVKNIAGQTFSYGSAFSILGYRDGLFLPLEELFESEELSAEDAEEIWGYYKQMLGRRNFDDNTDFREISEALDLQIEAAWEETETGPLSLYESTYYGIYQGYVILEKARDLSVSEDLTVDGILLIRAVNDMFGYKDGVFVPLKQLYETGVLDLVDVEQVSKIHKSRNWRYYDGSMALNVALPEDAQVQAVELAWYLRGGERLYLAENYYGRYKGSVLFVWGYSDPVIHEVLFRGQVFRFVGYQEIYIYRDRKFMTLWEFHKEQRLSESFFKELNLLHRERFPELYPEEGVEEPKPLSERKAKSLQNAWRENFGGTESFGEELIYYGTYHGNTVVYRSVDGYTGKKPYSVAGVSFKSYGYDYEIAVLHKGTFHLIQDAFLAGYLTEEDIQSIAKYHNARLLQRAQVAGITY